MKRARITSWMAPIMAVVLAGCAGAGGVASAPAPEAGYVAYVAAESADLVSRVRFLPGEGAVVESEREVGNIPVELEGPHGLAVTPDGEYYLVSIAHGQPYGSLLKISTETNEVVGRTTLGLFPATVGVTPDGEYAFVANFNYHGDPVPSSVSKVHLPSLTEVARIETCVMPHGARLNPQGTRIYSVCMMDQQLVEIDVESGEVSRRFSVAPGREGPVTEYEFSGMDHAMHGGEVCSPTWAQPSADGAFVYVACNKSDEILEIDTRSWTIARRFETGANPYNLDVSPNGRYLVASLKNRDAPATEVFDLETGRSLARVPNTDVLPHGVSITPDSRYVFVSVEGVGSDPGKVDVIDLRSLERVASVEVGQQAGGIAVLGGIGSQH
jgi:DNA-binding beta-propeller fold protein YncE